MFPLVALFVLALTLLTVDAFGMQGVTGITRTVQRSQIRMEYIPDGFTKAQWEEMKKKEAEANKSKNLGAVGITKFKSRSFEAWQLSGQKHLFPVDPSVPLEARPYMQRQGGSADGKDLSLKGIKPKGQAMPFAKTKVDEKYEKLEKEDKLRSTPFQVPWTTAAAQKIGKKEEVGAKVVSKATSKPTKADTTVTDEPKKKKSFFGLF